jgi:ferredoxin-NADP reductase
MAVQEVPSAGYRPRLFNRTEVAEGTMAFHFEKPSGFDFKAGQAADMTLLNPPETDSEGNVRTFSIASAPFENELMIATRMRDSAFKLWLKKMHKNPTKPAVFLAGGIGITPFLSILRQADHERMRHKTYLFYSNRRPEDAPFLTTLMGLEKTSPNFRFVGTMSEMARSSKTWDGETGWIDKEMLSRHLESLHGPIYYMAGPPAMVAGMRGMLVDAGVDEDDMRSEEFAGY